MDGCDGSGDGGDGGGGGYGDGGGYGGGGNDDEGDGDDDGAKEMWGDRKGGTMVTNDLENKNSGSENGTRRVPRRFQAGAP